LSFLEAVDVGVSNFNVSRFGVSELRNVHSTEALGANWTAIVHCWPGCSVPATTGGGYVVICEKGVETGAIEMLEIVKGELPGFVRVTVCAAHNLLHHPAGHEIPGYDSGFTSA
jgi:hypothetical protein